MQVNLRATNKQTSKQSTSDDRTLRDKQTEAAFHVWYSRRGRFVAEMGAANGIRPFA